MSKKHRKSAATLEKERALRKKLWLKLIKKWESEKIDRTQFCRGTLDDQPAFIDMTNEPVSARIEMLMKLRWLNYGPEALYGRLERVYSFGKIPPDPVPPRRRSGTRPARPRKKHPGS